MSATYSVFCSLMYFCKWIRLRVPLALILFGLIFYGQFADLFFPAAAENRAQLNLYLELLTHMY